MTYNYNARVEETRSIRHRQKRDNVRTMLLIKEAQHHGKLEEFANDIDMVLATTGNYLAAYDRFVGLKVLPKTVEDADAVEVKDVVYEMWNEVYDYTLHSQRYASVDKVGIKEMAETMDLQGYGKAMDIAKNPRSMIAAILGDAVASGAALQGLRELCRRDPEFLQFAKEAGLTFTFYEGDDGDEEERENHRKWLLGRRRPRLSFWARRIIALHDITMSTRERAFEDDNTPAGLYDACEIGIQNLRATQDLIKGRRDMNAVVA